MSSTTTNPLTGFLESLELRRIHPSRNALRNRLGSLDELIASIKEKGLLEPIVVRPVENGFEVVAGNRRLEACKRLKMRRIPCHIVELDDKEAFEVSLVENVQHETLNPIDEAKAFKKYVDNYGYGGVSELAKKIGKSQEYVSRRIQLLRLPKRVRDEVMRRRITPSVAQELASLDDEDASKAAEIIREQHLSMREARVIVRYSQARQQAQGELDSVLDTLYHEDPLDKRVRRIDRALNRAIVSLKMNMYRLSDVIDNLENEDEWFIQREVLGHYRMMLHGFIDQIIHLQKRGKSYSNFLVRLNGASRTNRVPSWCGKTRSDN